MDKLRLVTRAERSAWIYPTKSDNNENCNFIEKEKKNTAKEEDREKESIKYIIRVYCVCAI